MLSVEEMIQNGMSVKEIIDIERKKIDGGDQGNYRYHNGWYDGLCDVINKIVIFCNENEKDISFKNIDLSWGGASSPLCFFGKDLEGSYFEHSCFWGSDFRNTNLKNTNFGNCNLECAQFINSNLENVDFRGANLVGGVFRRSETKKN